MREKQNPEDDGTSDVYLIGMDLPQKLSARQRTSRHGLPAYVPTSSVSRSPDGSNRQERKDAVSSQDVRRQDSSVESMSFQAKNAVLLLPSRLWKKCKSLKMNEEKRKLDGMANSKSKRNAHCMYEHNKRAQVKFEPRCGVQIMTNRN